MISQGRYDKYVKLAEAHVDRAWIPSVPVEDEDNISVFDPSSPPPMGDD